MKVHVWTLILGLTCGTVLLTDVLQVRVHVHGKYAADHDDRQHGYNGDEATEGNGHRFSPWVSGFIITHENPANIGGRGP